MGTNWGNGLWGSAHYEPQTHKNLPQFMNQFEFVSLRDIPFCLSFGGRTLRPEIEEERNLEEAI